MYVMSPGVVLTSQNRMLPNIIKIVEIPTPKHTNSISLCHGTSIGM